MKNIIPDLFTTVRTDIMISCEDRVWIPDTTGVFQKKDTECKERNC
jgi:hypothetical protein